MTVPLIRDESAASGRLDLGSAWGMQTFAVTTPAAFDLQLASFHFRATVFSRLRPASFYGSKRI
jgi:hypothetical protein